MQLRILKNLKQFEKKELSSKQVIPKIRHCFLTYILLTKENESTNRVKHNKQPEEGKNKNIPYITKKVEESSKYEAENKQKD